MKKGIEIILDRPRLMRYNLGAIIRIEETLGKDFADIDFEKLRYKDLSVIIWAGLAGEDPSLTPEKVVRLIDDHGDLMEVSAAMGAALSDSYGSGEGNGQRAAENGTGPQPTETQRDSE